MQATQYPCFVIVPQSTIALTTTCGKYNQTLRPGCSPITPCVENVAGTMSLRVQELHVRPETKTLDNVFVQVACTVQYRVLEGEVRTAFYTLSNTEQQIKSYVYNSIRAQIPARTLDELFTCKDEIAAKVKEDVESQMNDYGYTISATLITDIEPDHLVKSAMNEINAARRLRDATRDRAEADRIAVVKKAEAEAESKRLSGTGLAEQRKAVVGGLQESIVVFAEGGAVSQGEVMELLMMNQYFDTLKDMSEKSKSTTLFVPHTPNAVGSLGEQLHAGLKAKAAP